jgi:hypothetical protein
LIASTLIETGLKWAIIGIAGALAGWTASSMLRVKPLQLEFDTFKFAVNARGVKQEVRVERVIQEIPVLQEVGRKEDAEKIADLRVRLRVAVDELRVERGRRSQLKDADTAPAECANYAAVPERLSIAHAEFLAREAARADFIAVQRDGCIRDYGIAKAKLDALAAGK